MGSQSGSRDPSLLFLVVRHTLLPEKSTSAEEYSEDPDKRVIYLTQRELNSIIANNPDLANRASVHLSEDKISAGLVVTLLEEMPVMAGKTVKVTTGLRVGYKDDRPNIVVEGVSDLSVEGEFFS